MTRRLMVVALVLLTAPAVMLSGQSRPDLSGKWVMDLERSETPTWEATPGPVTIVIEQSEGSLTKEIMREGETQRLTYRFDGQETVNAGGAAITRAQWDGPHLRARTDWHISGMAVTTEEVHRLSADGAELVVERRLAVQHGYQSVAPQQSYSSAVTDIFTRARE